MAYVWEGKPISKATSEGILFDGGRNNGISRVSVLKVSVYKFEVWVPIEPMSGTKAKRRYARKKELIDAIKNLKREELETSRAALSRKKVSIAVEFSLWKGDTTHTNTTGKKDIDNLLKIVFDALQTKVDEQGRMEGLGLIENDDNVYHVEATKRLVETSWEVGLQLTVAEHVI